MSALLRKYATIFTLCSAYNFFRQKNYLVEVLPKRISRCIATSRGTLEHCNWHFGWEPLLYRILRPISFLIARCIKASCWSEHAYGVGSQHDLLQAFITQTISFSKILLAQRQGRIKGRVVRALAPPPIRSVPCKKVVQSRSLKKYKKVCCQSRSQDSKNA